MRLWLAVAMLLNGCLTEFRDPPDAATCIGGCAGEGIAALDLADQHTCLVDDAGALWCWGNNRSGELGVPGADRAAQPLQVEASGWRDVRVGGGTNAHTCAIRDDATLHCWGANGDGQLGRADGSPSTQVGRSRWNAVDAGHNFSCAIRDDTSLHCWGSNESRRLGHSSPLSGPQETAGPDGWTAVSLGDGHACAVREDNTLYCWGRNSSGEASPDTLPVVEIPTLVDGVRVEVLSVGDHHTCAIDLAGALLCWGENDDGQLGHDGLERGPRRVGDRSDWVSVSAGGRHSCGVTADGSVLCWGANDFEQLGRGNRGDGLEPAEVAGDRGYVQVRAGRNHTCATRADASVRCWGLGDRTGLGTNRPVPTPSPLSFEE